MTFPTELERLLKEATEGPWIVRSMQSDCFVEGNEVVGKTFAGDYKREILSDEEYDKKKQDAELIVLLRNHADAILGLVRAAEMAQESLARHEEACKGWTDDHHVNTKLALHDALAKLNGGE